VFEQAATIRTQTTDLMDNFIMSAMVTDARQE